MGSKCKNLKGNKFNRLTVLKQSESRLYGNTKKRMWMCKCDCGNELILNTSALTSGNTKSCGCLHNEKSKENSIKSRYKISKKDAGFNNVKNSYKSNALSRNKSFELTEDELKVLFKSNCYYCGDEPSNIMKSSYYNYTYNGIDRIDNNIGYTKDNSVSCCYMCNRSKNNNTEKQFLDWAKRLNKYQIEKLQ